MRRPPFTPTAVRRAIGALQSTTTKENPVLTIEQLKTACALQAVKETEYLQQLQQQQALNNKLAGVVNERDKEIVDLKKQLDEVRTVVAPAADPVDAALSAADPSEGGNAD